MKYIHYLSISIGTNQRNTSSSQNFKVTPVGGVTTINDVGKTQRQSLMG